MQGRSDQLFKNIETNSKSEAAGPEVIKLFSCSTQLSTELILLINVKMQTVVSILTIISGINTTCEGFKARTVVIFSSFNFYKHLKFHAQFS